MCKIFVQKYCFFLTYAILCPPTRAICPTERPSNGMEGVASAEDGDIVYSIGIVLNR